MILTVKRLKQNDQIIAPQTTAEAVLVNTVSGVNSLANVLREIHVEVNNAKIVLDDKPTEGNTTHGVSSDGIFKELKNTVGNIQILLQKV